MGQLLLHHFCINTNCYPASLQFYQAVFHMGVVTETPNFHGRAYNTWLQNEQFMLELQTPKGGQMFQKTDTEQEGLTHICMYTDDIEARYRELISLGITSFLPHAGSDIYEVNGGKLFKLKAPEGTVIEFRDKKGC